MEASSQEPILTLADDLEGDIAAFRQRARERLDLRRRRLVELQQQITDQSRSLAGDLEKDRIRLTTEQTALANQRAEVEQHLGQLEALRSELSSDRSEWDSQQAHVIERQEQLLTALAEQHDRLEAVREELAVREQAFHEQQLQFEHEQTTFYSLQLQQAEREDQLDTKSRELSAGQASLVSSQQQLAAEEKSLQLQLTELEQLKAECQARQGQLKSLEEKTQHQRKQIAAQLRQHKSEALAEIERRQAEVNEVANADDSQLRRELELSQQQAARLREDVAHRESRIEEFQRQLAKAEEQHASAVEIHEQAAAQLGQKQQELAELKRQLDESLRKHEVYESKLEDRLAQLSELRQENERLRDSAKNEAETLANARSELERVRGQLEVFQQQHSETRTALEQKDEELKRLRQESSAADHSKSDAISLRKQIEELHRERETLHSKLQHVQADGNSDASSAAAELAELRRRYEATTGEIRSLKQSNRELEAKLARQPSGRAAEPVSPASSAGGKMDWESQKQRLLAQLEDDGEPVGPERKQERLKIEEVIRTTDRVIEDKEQELRELRQLLEDQSNNIGEVAVGASAIAAMLDSDELIREERESLKQLQVQWREKLRQAELDISVERAKVARDRTELDEKVEQFEKHRTKLEQELREGGADPAKKPNKRKWMDRLGIKNDDA